jgi:hypothetical protein
MNASMPGGANLYAYCLNNPVMFTDSTGMASFLDILKAVVVGIVIVIAVTALTVATAGLFAAALGATATVVNGIMVGAAIGGLIAGGINIYTQMSANGWDVSKYNYGELALKTFFGAAVGAAGGGIAGAFSAGVTGTALFTHTAIHIGIRIGLSNVSYLAYCIMTKTPVTPQGFMNATASGFVSGFISGVFFGF